jgi:hypothetical protein
MHVSAQTFPKSKIVRFKKTKKPTDIEEKGAKLRHSWRGITHFVYLCVYIFIWNTISLLIHLFFLYFISVRIDLPSQF